MADKVIFKSGNQDAFDNVVTKDKNTLYFIENTSMIYKGDTAVAKSTQFVNTLPEKPITDVLYVTPDGKTQVWRKGATTWEQTGLTSEDVTTMLNEFDETIEEDIVVTTKVGELAANTSLPAGTTVAEILTKILCQEKNPTKSNPSITEFNVTGNGATTTSFEVGTSVTPQWVSTFNKGSYSYKSTEAKDPITPVSGTGIADPTWSILQGSVEIGTTEDGTATSAFVIGEGSTGVSGSITFTAKATHEDGNYALTNLNKLPTTDVQIAGATVEKTDTLTYYRKMFAGGVNSDTTIDSTFIRGLDKSQQASKTTMAFSAAVGDKKLVVAFPTALTSTAPTFEYFTMSWEGFSGFVKGDTVQVADARGGESGKVDYTVYTYTPASAFEADTQFRVTLK